MHQPLLFGETPFSRRRYPIPPHTIRILTFSRHSLLIHINLSLLLTLFHFPRSVLYHRRLSFTAFGLYPSPSVRPSERPAVASWKRDSCPRVPEMRVTSKRANPPVQWCGTVVVVVVVVIVVVYHPDSGAPRAFLMLNVALCLYANVNILCAGLLYRCCCCYSCAAGKAWASRRWLVLLFSRTGCESVWGLFSNAKRASPLGLLPRPQHRYTRSLCGLYVYKIVQKCAGQLWCVASHSVTNMHICTLRTVAHV